MKKTYITITGTKHYYGKDFLNRGDVVLLKKDIHNEYDKEAIAVKMEGLGTIGYVANSPYTVIGECISAGRLYDRMKKTRHAKILYITDKGIVAEAL